MHHISVQQIIYSTNEDDGNVLFSRTQQVKVGVTGKVVGLVKDVTQTSIRAGIVWTLYIWPTCKHVPYILHCAYCLWAKCANCLINDYAGNTFCLLVWTTFCIHKITIHTIKTQIQAFKTHVLFYEVWPINGAKIQYIYCLVSIIVWGTNGN